MSHDANLEEFLSSKEGIGGGDWASGKYLIPDLTDEQKEPSQQRA